MGCFRRESQGSGSLIGWVLEPLTEVGTIYVCVTKVVSLAFRHNYIIQGSSETSQCTGEL